MSQKAPNPIRIQGAVLDHLGLEQPYAKSRPLKVYDLDLAPPGPGEVLIRVEAASICHSDLSVVNGDRPRPVPMLLGHESAGVIEQLGANVHNVQVGQHVVMTFLPRCGKCYGCESNGRIPCSNGTKTNNNGTLLSGAGRIQRGEDAIRHHQGVSCFADRAVVSASAVVPVSDDVPSEVAAMFGCALLTGGGAVINVLKPRPTDRLAVVGLGGVGLAALMTAKALGVRHVVGIDANPDKLAIAGEFGADEVYLPQDISSSPHKYDGVVEAAGHPSALKTALECTAVGGTTVTVGLPAPGSEVKIDPLQLTAEARVIVGSYLGSAVPSVDIPIYEQLWRDGKLPVEKLISHRIQLEEINEAMDALSNGQALRQVITFSDSAEQLRQDERELSYQRSV